MSPNAQARKVRERASVFAALGDETRLTLVAKLCDGKPHSITKLTRGTKLTRQAITKHLRVLESAGLVRVGRSGRERLFELKPDFIGDARRYLELVGEEWDRTLSRLKAFVEKA